MGLKTKALGSFTKREQAVSLKVSLSEPQVAEATSWLLSHTQDPATYPGFCVTFEMTYWSQ